ncbi:DNA cytosine methyltransferase [Ruficoccus amylovorans]|uniref:Cytosine-specific methyltransferase n=1 Tax=Ruficoccus amylovorans TaxID=1804625 RepID=A0A842HC42_9BACT|nr:DNA cytosine methyltransferase [Ruficoccus amylovorans]MBC2593749.1 DNA cytosine methyltransferase [Ruficoccus amylovorans]
MSGVLSNPTVVDLFSGAGVFSLAFQDAGAQLVRAYELDEAAANTYRRNLGDHIVVGDVKAAHPEGRCDILIAGPPCQGFSTSGKRSADDPRNQLSRIVPIWAEKLQPQVIVIENVAPYLKSAVWEENRNTFERMGYHVEAFLVNALDFGVPQNRARSITICSKNDIPNLARPRRFKRKTVRDAFDGLGAREKPEMQHVWFQPTPLALERLSHVPPGGDIRNIAEKAPELVPKSWWKVRSKIIDIWGRLSWEGPSKTVKASFPHLSKGRYAHPEYDRLISIREAARLQSVPDGFHFTGTIYQCARQIGNCVPYKMGKAIATDVINSLN